MIKRGIVLGLGILLVLLLSACSEAEEILGKVNKILDQQLAEEEDITEDEGNVAQDTATTGETTGETTESGETANAGETEKGAEQTENVGEPAGNETTNTASDGMSDGHENEADEGMPNFEERLKLAGYTKIDPPNGMPLPISYDWVLVQVIHEEGPWEGVFCFESPLEETIAQTEADFQTNGFSIISDPITGNSANVHATKYQYQSEYKGDLIYFIDDFGTTCTKVWFEIIFD